jgi:hypothetical protein
MKAGDRYDKDPDRRVQEAITLVFDKVQELGSRAWWRPSLYRLRRFAC